MFRHNLKNLYGQMSNLQQFSKQIPKEMLLTKTKQIRPSNLGQLKNA